LENGGNTCSEGSNRRLATKINCQTHWTNHSSKGDTFSKQNIVYFSKDINTCIRGCNH
jgi:hypothetical protein